MNAIPVLTIEDVAMLDGVLGDFLKKTESELTVVIDRGGNVISQCGDMDVMDVTVIAALAAGSFAATRELAHLLHHVAIPGIYDVGCAQFCRQLEFRWVGIDRDDAAGAGLQRLLHGADVADAAADLHQRVGDILAQIRYRGARFIIERRGTPVAAVVSMQDLAQLQQVSTSVAQSPSKAQRRAALERSAALRRLILARRQGKRLNSAQLIREMREERARHVAGLR